jgi:hypothetical protein
MLDLLTVTYAQFVTKVKEQQCLHWPIAGWRGFQKVEAPSFIDIRICKCLSVCQSYIVPQEIFVVPFVSGAVMTPGTLCSQLGYVNETF